MTLPGPLPRWQDRVNAPLHGLVLAAGQGHRFGGDKLHAGCRGRPLLSHALAVVESACTQGVLAGGHVVIAAGDHLATRLVQAAGLVPVVNDAPSMGLSHSLRLGLTSLETMAGESSAAVIFLGDQPLVRLDVVEQLARAWRQGRGTIIRPRYESTRDAPGHPVVLSREMWPHARSLDGDLGFKAVLDPASPGNVIIDFAGDNPDVDTQADLQAIERAQP